ncbi:MAG: hypothetical protein JWR50_3267 [Mucilaginibacter sp.]|nr:hypothetical protein [Mucilaginibacter sp.]
MKTSNKLLVAATLLIVGYLVTYDLSIKAEYYKGDFKSRFYNFTRLPVKDFNAVEDNLGDAVDIIVEQGSEYTVWVNKDVKDDYKVINKKKTLSIDFKAGIHHAGVVYVICPQLNKMTVRDRILLRNQVNFGGSNTSINGFKQDTMYVYGRGSSLIHMSGNVLNKLNVDIAGNGIMLNIGNTNKIINGNFDIQGQARFELLGPVVEKPVYNVDDQATITLTGETFRKSSIHMQ